MRTLCAAACSFVLSVSAYAGASVLDTNFTQTDFVTAGLNNITGIVWATDGSNRLFVALKDGEVRIVKDGQLLATPFATVSPIETNSECGVIGICLDPAFSTNKFVYLFVTVSTSEQQIIRYTDNNDIGSNKTTILPGLPTAGNNHDGGGIAFGPDGNLYFAIGDLGNGTGVDADLTTLASKVGRCTPAGAVPTGNPFADGGGSNNDYIFARGFRNPFTLTFQPGTGKLWVNCVGTSQEQIFLVESGDHAGWNDFENNQPTNFITPRIKYRTNGTDSRNIAGSSGAVRAGNVITITTTANHGFRKGEKITLSGVTPSNFNGSVFVASTPSATTFTASQTGPDATGGSGTAVTQDIGGCVTGGCFYDGSTFPTGYLGNFFFGDLNDGRIMRAVIDATDNSVVSVDEFITGASSPTDMAVGPDGSLYYAQLGGSIFKVTPKNPQTGIIVSASTLSVAEGASGTFTVRLATAPTGTVTVAAAISAGDTDITVTGGASLQFDANNFSTPQTVTISAAEDPDTFNDSATVTLSAATYDSRTVAVTVTDNDSSPAPIVDSDNDGVSDSNETADGTNPLDATSFNTIPFTIAKLTGNVKFGLSGKDKASIAGIIPALPAGFDPASKIVLVDIAGVTGNFTLTEKASHKKDDKSQFSVKLKPSKRNKMTKKLDFLGGDVAFKASLPGTHAAAWAGEGVAANIKDKIRLTFRVDVAMNGRRYRADVPVDFRSSEKSGSVKKAKE